MATQALAANGATVYIVGRRLEALQTVTEKYSPKIGGGKIIPKAADISDKDAIKKLVDEIGAEVGDKGIQVLCNNAGVAEEQKTTSFSQEEAEKLDYSDAEQLGKWLWRSEMEGWEKTFKTNVFAQVFWRCQGSDFRYGRLTDSLVLRFRSLPSFAGEGN